MALVDLIQFKAPPARISFYNGGVVVGTIPHKLVMKFGAWKQVPGTESVFWCGINGHQFTMVAIDGKPSEIAYYNYSTVSEFKKERGPGWAANAIYYRLGKDGVPEFHTYALLQIIGERGIEL